MNNPLISDSLDFGGADPLTHTTQPGFRHGESQKKFIMVGVGLEPTTQKTHGPTDDAIC